MAARNSSSSYKFQALVTMLSRYRVTSGGSWWAHGFHRHDVSPYKMGCGVCESQGLRFISATTSGACRQPKLGMDKDDQSEEGQVQPPLPAPPKFGFPNWMKWFLGSVISLLLPFCKKKWDNLLMLEGEAVKVVEEVEVAAEVVEKVATTADKALAEVANQLPDNSKLKKAAQAMEHASRAAVQDALLIENIIHKVGDVKQDLEDLETMAEPIIDKIIQGKHPKNY